MAMEICATQFIECARINFNCSQSNSKEDPCPPLLIYLYDHIAWLYKVVLEFFIKFIHNHNFKVFIGCFTHDTILCLVLIISAVALTIIIQNIKHISNYFSTVYIRLLYVLSSVYRRICHRLMGYRRPPFRIVRLKRQRWFFKFLKAEGSNGQLRWGWYCSKGVKTSKSQPNKDFHLPDEQHALYLWPDRLRWYYWGHGFIIAAPFMLSPLFNTNYKHQELFCFIFIATSLLLSISIIIPCIIHCILRIPILDILKSKKWPLSIEKWISDLFIDQHRTRYFPPFKEEMDAFYWSPKSSPQKTFLKLAIRELHQVDIAKSLVGWLDRAFFRWFFYWCAPVWASYGLLSILLFVGYHQYKTQLVIAVLLWLLLSINFIWSEFNELALYTKLYPADYRLLPPAIYPFVIEASMSVQKLTEDQVKGVFAAINIACTSVYLIALQTLNSGG